MKRLLFLVGFSAVSLLLVTQSAFAVANNPCTAAEIARGKTTVCHVPPGNPANAMTICVGSTGANSPAAHLANHPGDSLGACTVNLCGNGVCDETENCGTCPADCGCDDHNACTADSCTNGGCTHDPIQGCCLSDTDCPAATNCTTASTCDLATNTCTAGTAVDCNDNNPCTDDSCDPATGCVNVDNATCCCQQTIGTGNHCFAGCDGCNATCTPGSCDGSTGLCGGGV